MSISPENLDNTHFRMIYRKPSLTPQKTACQVFFYTLIDRKSRMSQIQGVKGEAVVSYCESLTTKEMEYHRLSRRVNKMKISSRNYNSLIEVI